MNLSNEFGLTLGNALRASCCVPQGSAVTAIQIDGVLRNFIHSGVHEDVTDIVLNIKSMGIRMHGEVQAGLIAGRGPGEVTAGMIDSGHDIDVMDPDLVICTLMTMHPFAWN